MSRSHRPFKHPQRVKYRLPLNRMPHHSKNREPTRHLTAHRTTWVYVPGFGWIESQGPNHAEYAEDMYENGNKIGIMG